MFGESTLRARCPDENNNRSAQSSVAEREQGRVIFGTWGSRSGPTPAEKRAIAGRIWLVVCWPRIALRKSQVKFVWDEVFWKRAAGALTAHFV